MEEKWEQYTKSGLNIEINGTPLELKHMGTSFYPKSLPQRAISLMWNQRSVDTFLGLPFNIASYGLLLEIIAKIVNIVPDELIGNLGDVHLYSNHIEQAKEQIGRKYTPDERSEMLKESMGYENYHNAIEELMPFGGGLSEYYDSYKIPYNSKEPFPLPTLKHMKTDDFYKSLSDDISLITHLDNTDFVIENYQSHPTIKAPLSN
jgi:thymidylate synthase